MKFDRSLLTFNPKNHGHYYDGRRLTSVTTVLGIVSKGDAIPQWAVNQAIEYIRENLKGELTSEDVDLILHGAKLRWRSVRQEAADIGTQAHNWIERYLKGENPEWPEHPNVRNSCEAAVKWIEQHHWITRAIEQQLYLPDLGVAGICDWWAEIDGELCVPDWKTSKALYGTYRYQTAAYAKAIEEEYGIKSRTRWLLRIDKETGEFEDLRIPKSEFAADYRAFKAAVQLYKREQEVSK